MSDKAKLWFYHDENWITKEYPTGFDELQRTPTKNYFVLIEFRKSKNTAHDIAIATKVFSKDAFVVAYLRNSLKMEGKFTHSN